MAELDKNRYELVLTEGGAIVYKLKDKFANEEPPHYICPRCFEIRGKRSFIQPSVLGRYQCDTCFRSYKVKESTIWDT